MFNESWKSKWEIEIECSTFTVWQERLSEIFNKIFPHTQQKNIVMIMMTWYFIYDIVQNYFTFSMKCHAQLRFSIDFEWKTLELDIFCEDAHVYRMNEVLWRLLMKFERNRWKREILIQNPSKMSTLERIIIYNEHLLNKINKFQEEK